MPTQFDTLRVEHTQTKPFFFPFSFFFLGGGGGDIKLSYLCIFVKVQFYMPKKKVSESASSRGLDCYFTPTKI